MGERLPIPLYTGVPSNTSPSPPPQYRPKGSSASGASNRLAPIETGKGIKGRLRDARQLVSSVLRGNTYLGNFLALGYNELFETTFGISGASSSLGVL